eukprot:838637-Rhodomonas_salina.1
MDLIRLGMAAHKNGFPRYPGILIPGYRVGIPSHFYRFRRDGYSGKIKLTVGHGLGAELQNETLHANFRGRALSFAI